MASFPLFAELSLRGWFPLWVALLLGVVAALGVALLYTREAGRIGALPRAGMALIRVAIVGVVAFLLLRPVWVVESNGQKARPVAVLFDISQSMDNRDPRPNPSDAAQLSHVFDSASAPTKPSRLETARAALTNPKLALLRRLSSVGPVEMATFGSRRTGRDALDQTWLGAIVADPKNLLEPRTALASAAFEVLNRDANDQPGSIVLVTDGRDNASDKSLDDLARECERLKIPVYIYGVGSSAYGQVQLRDAAVPETLFVDDTAAVAVRYRVRGITQGRVEIVLTYGDRVVASKEVDAREGDDLREILTFVPSKEDAAAKKAELKIEIKVSTGTGVTVESVSDELAKAVKVVDRKLKVLVIDSLPRWDFKFMQRALLRDRRVEARFILTEGDDKTMKSGPPWMTELAPDRTGGLKLSKDELRKILFDFDLIILGDVPVRYFSPDQQEVVKEFVAEGGGMVQIAGRWHAPAGWAGGPIADVLPVEFTAVKFPLESAERPTPYRPVLVQAAARNPIVSLEDDPIDNTALWRKLPELYWHYPVTKLKPAADAYAVHPRARTTDDKPMPLLAGHYYGKGFVLFVGFDETWRWRFNEAEKYFGRFWSQAVYVAGVPRTVGTKLTQLSLDTPDPTLGKTGQVYARLFTKEFKPLKADKIEARLEKLDADPNEKDRVVPVTLYALRDGGNEPTGEYVAAMPFNRPGRFALKVEPGNDNPATLDYRVNLPPEHELAPGGLAENEMRKLAEATGGKFYREEDLQRLPDEVKAQYAPFSRRDETTLWNKWAMVLLIGLLTLEWVVRKLNSLS
ncbi:MAG TPA: hypothetical protein VMZ71_11560 [Gemmataceae bacterium]|nr:hypothetical protein [Gemmataceae bacterium]